MKNKKIVSMIVMFSIFINIISGLHIDAQAENTENSETYLWDFSKYTDKITTTKTGFTEKYDGLTIAIADNGDDSISTGGVYWRGGTSSGESTTRYISYTPTKNGTLSATGKLNATGGRWGISTSLNVGTFVAASSTTSTSSSTVSMDCTAGTTYYIFTKAKSATVASVKYTETAESPTTAPTDEPDTTDPPRENIFENGKAVFSFGSGNVEGSISVKGGQYSETAKYGFTDGSGLSISDNSISSASDYTFNVLVENGNYNVTIDTTADKISYEKVPNISADVKRTTNEKTFTAAVCDGVLDITIPGGASISGLTVEKAEAKAANAQPALYAIGDSTVNTDENNSYTWGKCIDAKYVTLPDNIGSFVNCGYAGTDSAKYYNDGYLDRVLLNICPGDYVTVNMGINKNKVSNESGAYKTLIKDYFCKGIIERGGIPIILTATARGPVDTADGREYSKAYSNGVFHCDRSYKYDNSLYDDAHNSDLRAVASELNLEVIEVGAWCDNYFNSLTQADAEAARFKNVLELVQSWYPDHNHYKQALGEKIASYITSEVATRISASKNSIRTGMGKNIVADVSGNMAAIDTSTLPSGGNVSEYEITLSKGGKLLRKNRVPCSEKVYTETIGADKVEIVPVYRYENVQNVNNGITLGEFEEGLYNITFKKNGKARCDIYVNGAMVGNNIDQSGEGRKPSSGSVYTQFH